MGGLDVVPDILRTITFFIDDKVYGLIPTIYGLFLNLSQIDLLSGDNNPISALISRVYVFLGIFMLFRVAFSLLQYMVDPNSFSDSAKGFGKLVTNSLVSLALLILTPWIFSTAMDIQNVVINQNIIPKLVLGSGITAGDSNTSTGSQMSVEFAQELAKDTQFMMFGAFYYVDGEVLVACKDTPVFGTIGMATNDECLQALDSGFSEEEAIYSSNVQLSSFFKTADASGNVTDNRNFSHFDKLLWWKMNGNYVIKYIPFISSIAGIYVVFLLVTFCVDVAIRILKLAFLQAVAPIAIISYVDPKESTSNSKLFNWIKETGKTYFSLFLRLAMIYLVLLLISAIANTVLASGNNVQSQITDSSYTMWVYLFLVIASFMFAKKVPELLERIFGMKGTGEFNLNPLKTFTAVRDSGFGALAGGAVGLGLGTVSSGAAAFSATRDEGGNVGTAIRRGIGGAVGGAFRGTVAGFRSGGKQMVSKSLDVAGVAGRNAALKTNTTLAQRMGAQARQAVGMQSKKEGMDKRIGYHNDLAKHVSTMKDRATDQLSKKSDKWKWTQQERANLQEAVKNKQDIHYTDKNGNKVVASYNDQKAYQAAYASEMGRMFSDEQKMIKDYINTGGFIRNGNVVVQKDNEDYQITIERDAFIKEYNDNKLSYTDDNGNPLLSKETGAPIVVNQNIQWDDMDTLGKAAQKEAAKLTNSEEYQDAEIIDQMQRSGIMQSHFGGNH